MIEQPAPSAPDVPEPAEDYEDLYENAPCGYLSMRPDGRIFKVNGTFATWLGFSAESLAGRRFQDLLNIAGKVYYETHFAPLLRMQGFFNEVAFDLVCADGRRLPVLVNASQRCDGAGTVLFTRLTFFNATDRRRYERELLVARRAATSAAEELRALNAALEQRVADEVTQRMAAEEAMRHAQKMEAVGQLTGGIAHDFNNLLTAIAGSLELIENAVGQDHPARRLAAAALRAADRGARLVSSLLAFSRKQRLEVETIDVNSLVHEFEPSVRRAVGSTVQLVLVLEPMLSPCRGDAAQLEAAVLNLAINARDAMPDGGTLRIATRNASLDAVELSGNSDAAPGPFVALAVEDTGHGMAPDVLERVFDPFFTTKGVGKGTGLGLSQVYGFAHQLGGHVAIDSTPDAGTRVTMYLPAVLAAPVGTPV